MCFWKKEDPMVSQLKAFFAAEGLDQMRKILKRHRDVLLTDRAIEFMEVSLAALRNSPTAGELAIERQEVRLRVLVNARRYGIENAHWPMIKLTRELVKRISQGGVFDVHAPGIDGRGADLIDVDLYGADLRGVDFRGAKLRGTSFYRASLSGANLSGLDLRETNFNETDLSFANLSDANLFGNGLSGNLRGADFRRADLRDCRLHWGLDNLNGADLRGAQYSKRGSEYDTSWPEEFDPIAAGAIRVDSGMKYYWVVEDTDPQEKFRCPELFHTERQAEEARKIRQADQASQKSGNRHYRVMSNDEIEEERRRGIRIH